MSEKTYFNACWLLSPRYWTGFHVVAPAKKQNGSYVNLLLNYHICGKLHSRVMLVVKSISKNLKICARSKNFLIPRSQWEMGGGGGGGGGVHSSGRNAPKRDGNDLSVVCFMKFAVCIFFRV